MSQSQSPFHSHRQWEKRDNNAESCVEPITQDTLGPACHCHSGVEEIKMQLKPPGSQFGCKRLSHLCMTLVWQLQPGFRVPVPVAVSGKTC